MTPLVRDALIYRAINHIWLISKVFDNAHKDATLEETLHALWVAAYGIPIFLHGSIRKWERP
jgi:hypothetical protein